MDTLVLDAAADPQCCCSSSVFRTGVQVFVPTLQGFIWLLPHYQLGESTSRCFDFDQASPLQRDDRLF